MENLGNAGEPEKEGSALTGRGVFEVGFDFRPEVDVGRDAVLSVRGAKSVIDGYFSLDGQCLS